MSRLARVVVPELPHHVTQRGNRREAIFFEDADRFEYLNLVRNHFRRYELSAWAYCLMTNHVHFVVVPQQADALALAFRDAHSTYALSLNRRRRSNGHLWQGRFFSCPLDEAHLWSAVRYVERNPVRAGMVETAGEYRWSSAAARCKGAEDPLLSNSFPPPGVIEDWSKWLALEDCAETKRIRACTQTGRPCGSERFTERLENVLGRSFQLGKSGPKAQIVDDETFGLFDN